MAYSTSNSAVNSRTTYPTTFSEHIPAASATDTSIPTDSWTLGFEPMASPQPDTLLAAKAATIGASKMEAAAAVRKKFSPTFGISLCLTAGGAAMQIACLGFLINDFINNPEVLAANSGRQALYGVGLTAGVFSLVTGGCCLVLDVN